MGRPTALWAVLLGVGLGTGCGAQMVCDPNHREHCVTRGGPGTAAATTAAAAGLWAATGCSMQGCRPPFVCNHEKKRCERQRCGEGVGGCPVGFECDSDEHVCR